MWIYGQRTGALVNGSASILVASGTGYAGRGPCRNEPSAQRIKNFGPLPCGLYTIERPHDSPRTGPLTLSLTPDPRNEMFGRSAFAIHGDNDAHDASDGCIIMSRTVRETLARSTDNVLLVVPFI